ncbi:hypothetical protein [Morococcus cerebrosus]|uniref:hypothetical protein n=1 Tax=Morococcus cerebrosus TaxID=1056807 RepID=UPI0006676EF8|nr:hypothetical protein [Morococcus cerebrosus]MDU4438035.1 hypothetical protein [Neisseria sp.]
MDNVAWIFINITIGVVLIMVINAIFAVFIVRFRLRFWLWFRLRLRLWLRLRLRLWLRLWFLRLYRWAVRINIFRRNRFWSWFRVIRFTWVAIKLDYHAFVSNFWRWAVCTMTDFAMMYFDTVRRAVVMETTFVTETTMARRAVRIVGFNRRAV